MKSTIFRLNLDNVTFSQRLIGYNFIVHYLTEKNVSTEGVTEYNMLGSNLALSKTDGFSLLKGKRSKNKEGKIIWNGFFDDKEQQKRSLIRPYNQTSDFLLSDEQLASKGLSGYSPPETDK